AESSRIPVAIIDQEHSAISRGIVASLTADKALAVTSADLEAARASVRKGKTTVAVVIPKHFGADAGRAFFSSAAKPELQILYDPSHSVEFNMVQGILTGQVMQVVSKEMFSGESGQRMVRESLDQLDRIPGLAAGQKQTLGELLRNVQKWNSQSGAPGTSSGLAVP